MRGFLRLLVRLVTAAHAWRLFRRWSRRSERDYQRLRKDRERFEANLYGWWAEALDWLDVLWLRATEEGGEFNIRQQAKAARDDDAEFEALRRLHARACRIASEVGALLRTGHPEGAFARWRTLHEINVTMQFIAEHGDDVARRYLSHTGARLPRLITEYQTHIDELGGERLTAEVQADALSEHASLVAQYGEDYDKEYGWAVAALDDRGPTFKKIEAAVGMDAMRPWYRLASEGSHAGTRALEFTLALPTDTELLLTGASDTGLYEPGAATAISLVDATLCFLGCRADVRAIAACLVLGSLVEDAQERFEHCSERIMRDGQGAKTAPATPR